MVSESECLAINIEQKTVTTNLTSSNGLLERGSEAFIVSAIKIILYQLFAMGSSISLLSIDTVVLYLAMEFKGVLDPCGKKILMKIQYR